MNVVYYGDFARTQVCAGLSALDLSVVSADAPAQLDTVMARTDILIISGPDYTENVAHVVNTGKRLGLIQLTTSGFENLRRFGVPAAAKIANAADAWSVAVAEHAMALMLALGKQLTRAHAQQRDRCWDRGYVDNALEFCGATLLIVGMGRIGRAIAQRAKAFDMRVMAAVPTERPAPEHVDEVITEPQLAAALARADVVMAAMPSTPATYHMFNRERFAQCKRGALFINIARGDVVDTSALCWALETAQLGGAGIDVTEPEPLAADSRLWQTPNLLITPAVFQRIRTIVVDNVQRYLRREPLAYTVRLEPFS